MIAVDLEDAMDDRMRRDVRLPKGSVLRSIVMDGGAVPRRFGDHGRAAVAAEAFAVSLTGVDAGASSALGPARWLEGFVP